MKAFLCMDGWAGRREYEVTVVGEATARKRLRIRNDRPISIPLAGPNRWLDPGKTALVPASAVRIPTPA